MGWEKYPEVSIKGVKRWTDSEGKKRQATKKFWQTLSPFNTKPDGTRKTEGEIRAELIKEREEWLKS